jgi:GT2 family glycosyltransferase
VSGPSHPDLGAVVIGRDEGQRLVRCLESLRGCFGAVVFADSASQDGSPERARALGAEVVVLDRVRPQSAARGRNAGARRLLEVLPGARAILFIDGDCQLSPGFLARALATLDGDARAGAVCGRRREERPEASPYHRLVDAEWNTPLGEAESFGGDVLVRRAAWQSTGGYDESLVTGEDPELSFRLRRAGWRILRIDAEMTRHDVALDSFARWWRRHARGGEAYALCARKHLAVGERMHLRRLASILFWGMALPVVALLAACLVPGGWIALPIAAVAYAGLWWRVRRWRMERGAAPRVASEYAFFITLGKLAEAQGALRALLR